MSPEYFEQLAKLIAMTKRGELIVWLTEKGMLEQHTNDEITREPE